MVRTPSYCPLGSSDCSKCGEALECPDSALFAEDKEEWTARTEKEEDGLEWEHMNFDPRLDAVIARFRARYPLPIIAQAAWHEGWDDASGPSADLYVYNAPIPYMSCPKEPSREEEELSDFLYACAKYVESKSRGETIRLVPMFFPPSESSHYMKEIEEAAEEDGGAWYRYYGVPGRKSQGEPLIEPIVPQGIYTESASAPQDATEAFVDVDRFRKVESEDAPVENEAQVDVERFKKMG